MMRQRTSNGAAARSSRRSFSSTAGGLFLLHAAEALLLLLQLQLQLQLQPLMLLLLLLLRCTAWCSAAAASASTRSLKAANVR